jgi:hypothetical protein
MKEYLIKVSKEFAEKAKKESFHENKVPDNMEFHVLVLSGKVFIRSSISNYKCDCESFNECYKCLVFNFDLEKKG